MQNQGKKKILLVEDEPHLAFNLQLNLKAEGYLVEHADTGELALEKYKLNGPFDLILLDVMIPEPDGFQVAKTVRIHDEVTSIIMITARASDKDRIAGLELGVDDYISKPFNLNELFLKVKRATTRSSFFDKRLLPKDQPSVLEAGGFRLDTESLELQTPNGTHSITALEADVFTAFMQNEGRVLSRDYLLRQVWGMHGNVETRTVDNFVMRLRKYVEKDPSNPKYLASVRGRGYRFNSDPDL